MKTKLKIITAIFLVCALGLFLQKHKAVQTETNLLLLNIEALAQSEGSNARCMGVGSVDCPINSDKVYMVF